MPLHRRIQERGDSVVRIEREHGVLEWERNAGHTYELRNIDVEANFRRQGIGRALMEELEELVVEEGGLCIYGFTAGDNRIAQAFYRALGFELVHLNNFYGYGRDGYIFHKAVR